MPTATAILGREYTKRQSCLRSGWIVFPSVFAEGSSRLRANDGLSRPVPLARHVLQGVHRATLVTQRQDAKDFTAVRRGEHRTCFWRLGTAPLLPQGSPACSRERVRRLALFLALAIFPASAYAQSPEA